MSFILASPSLPIIQNDSVMKVARYRAAWHCDVQLSPAPSISREGGRPSTTRIKEGLRNGGWEVVCASSHARLFVDLSVFWTFQHIWPRFVQTVIRSRRRGEELVLFKPIITRCFVSRRSPRKMTSRVHRKKKEKRNKHKGGFFWGSIKVWTFS